MKTLASIILFVALCGLLAILGSCFMGCAVQADATPSQAQEDVSGEPWRTCLLDRPVCVEAVYCEPGTDDERCIAEPDGACLVRPVPQGEECLDVARSSGVGHCDGKGSCL